MSQSHSHSPSVSEEAAALLAAFAHRLPPDGLAILAALDTGTPPPADFGCALPPGVALVLWKRLRDATAGARAYRASIPPDHQPDSAPLLQHTSLAPFPEDGLPPQPQPNLRRLLRLETWQTLEAAEAFILALDQATLDAFRAQCVRLAQLCWELTRRSWAWVAEKLLDWEGRLLGYRGSSIAARLFWNDSGIQAGDLADPW